jgi:hypothetical protein
MISCSWSGVCVLKSFVFIYFQNGNSCIFFLNTATIAFNFICKNKCYLKKNSLQRALDIGSLKKRNFRSELTRLQSKR